MSSRYIIGIDLGTTNSAVAYVDTTLPSLPIQSFMIPQEVEEGLTQPKDSLPSFCLLPERVVGIRAKEEGAKSPTRLVQSAKSWLCNAAAARKEKILPRENPQISPVEASSLYLNHIRTAWNVRMGKGDPDLEFEQQEVLVTVPASFDEVARQLTVEAAKLAGFRHLTLLEEPQAAFYAFINKHPKFPFHKEQQILVVDVGGGTTDLSLIEVAATEPELAFTRMKVGEHLLLGGDNFDHMIAHELGFKGLDQEQKLQLLHASRDIKEQGSGKRHVTLQGKGRKVVGGSESVEVDCDQIRQKLLEGFFKFEPLEEAVKIERTGMRSIGLAYEREPSILKHIAAFLQGQKAPDWVLFNGGTMTPAVFRGVVLDALEKWYQKRPEELASDSLDLAVSRGAATYGKVRRGHGIKVKAGIPRAFYLGIEQGGKEKGLTLLSRGTEEGCELQSEHTFTLLANQPVQFPLYTSSTRLGDQPSDLVPIHEEQMQLLAPMHTVLRYGKKQGATIDVCLHTKLTEVGTLELWLQAPKTGHKWSLEFQLRGVEGQEDQLLNQSDSIDERLDEKSLQPAIEILDRIYSENELSPKSQMSELEQVLGEERIKWSPSVLRALADHLLLVASNRRKSEACQKAWWNGIGFFLRPGLGHPLDDHRMKKLWQIILQEKGQSASIDLQLQQWICFRRVAAGLNKGQQMQLASSLMAKKGDPFAAHKGLSGYGEQELIRLLGALELLPRRQKERLATQLLSRITSKKSGKAESWALGRIGARHLVGGTIADVLPATTCLSWANRLLELDSFEELYFPLQQMGRKTEQEELDLPEGVRKRIASYGIDLETIDDRTEALRLGDRLPIGLKLS